LTQLSILEYDEGEYSFTADFAGSYFLDKRSFLRHRFRYHWLLLLTLIFGVILGSTFLASGPVLVDALLEFGLRRTLLNADLREDVFYLTLRETSNQNQFEARDAQVQSFVEERLPNLVAKLTPTGHVGFMYPWQNDRLILDHRLTLGFYGSNQDELKENVNLVAGAFPEEESSAPDEIPIFIGKFLADDLSLEAGDLLPASISARADHPEVNLRITGIITPRDFQDPYWLDHFNPFWPQDGNGEIDIYGIFVPRESFSKLASRFYPGLDISYIWLVNLHLGQFSFKNISELQRLFATLGDDVLLIDDGLRVNTSLVELLRAYSTQANIARAP
jgi:hypothetical protein